VVKYLESQSDSDSVGLLKTIKNIQFVFGITFLSELFLLANTTSDALQASDIDLAVAAVAIEYLSDAINKMRNSDSECERVYGIAREQCNKLGIDCVHKRKRAVPGTLRNCVMNSFLTTTSDAAGPTDLAPSHEDQTKQTQKLDFYIPVLDIVSVALATCFSINSTAVIKHIPSVLTLSDNFQKDFTRLGRLANLDAELCVAQGKLLLKNQQYMAPNNPTSLQNLANKMFTLQHIIAYKEYYLLIVYFRDGQHTARGPDPARDEILTGPQTVSGRT